MASELQITIQSGKAIYAILRRLSDSKVWNVATSAWATWSDGSVTDYDIALTDQSGDLYVGDFPSTITAGTAVRIQYYIRAGASPATSDLLVLSEAKTWDGGALGSSSSVSLQAGNLTTLESLKRHLRITSSSFDTLLTELINQISDKIRRLCGRDFAAADYREWADGNDQSKLTVKHWPIIHVDRLAYGRANALRVQYVGSAIRATMAVTESGIRLSSMVAAGTITTTALTFADYPTLSLMRAAIAAVSGWTASLDNDAPSADLHPMGGVNAKTAEVTLTYPDQDDLIYDVDYSAGIIAYRSPAAAWNDAFGDGPPQRGIGRQQGQAIGWRNILIQYRGGYESIPDDVANVANNLIGIAYRAGTHDWTLASESLGDYSYTLADQVELTERDMAALRPYMELR